MIFSFKCTEWSIGVSMTGEGRWFSEDREKDTLREDYFG